MAKKTYRARDIMTTDVVCVYTGTTLQELEKVFLEKGISGAPVIDEQGLLLGVISQTDLIYFHLTRGDHPLKDSDFYRTAQLDEVLAASGFHIENHDVDFVGDVMTPVVHTVDPETSVLDLARLMTVAKIHRVIITEDRKVVGLVSAMDLLRMVSNTLAKKKTSTEANAVSSV